MKNVERKMSFKITYNTIFFWLETKVLQNTVLEPTRDLKFIRKGQFLLFLSISGMIRKFKRRENSSKNPKI